MKTCSKCKEEKPFDDFHKHTTSPDGLAYVCKTCTAKRAKDYRVKNREKRRIKLKEWRSNNRKHVCEYRKAYYQKNIKKLRHQDSKLRDKHKDVINERNRNNIANLSDTYIKYLLTVNSRLKFADVTNELIELKRLQILIHREVRK